MPVRLPIACCLSFSSLASVGFGCEHPALVEIPGEAEARRESNSIRAATERYVVEMFEYVDCIRAEIDAAGGADSPALLQALLVQRNNAAVAEVRVVMDLYEQRVGPLESLAGDDAPRAVPDFGRAGAPQPEQIPAPRSR